MHAAGCSAALRCRVTDNDNELPRGLRRFFRPPYSSPVLAVVVIVVVVGTCHHWGRPQPRVPEDTYGADVRPPSCLRLALVAIQGYVAGTVRKQLPFTSDRYLSVRPLYCRDSRAPARQPARPRQRPLEGRQSPAVRSSRDGLGPACPWTAAACDTASGVQGPAGSSSETGGENRRFTVKQRPNGTTDLRRQCD